MMTAMTRLPCKQLQTSPSPTARYANSAVQLQHHEGRAYWGIMDQPVVAPPPAYAARPRPGSAQLQHKAKRKSAVELLQESKAFYVKSETVLDRKQELKNSEHFRVSQLTATGAPPRLLRKPCPTSQLAQTAPPPQTQCCWSTTCLQDLDRPDGTPTSGQRPAPPALPPKSPRQAAAPLLQRRSVPAPPATSSSVNSEQLQAKLRRLLNADSKENVFYPPEQGPLPVQLPGYASPSHLVGRDNRLRHSSGENASLAARDDERTWEATGGEVRFKFGRSNSHSHGRVGPGRASSGGTFRAGNDDGGPDSATSASLDHNPGSCHKSLPDLHTPAWRRRPSLSPRSSARKAQPSPCCADCETGSDASERSFNRDSVCHRSGSSSRCLRRSMGSGGGNGGGGGDGSSIFSSGSRTQKSSGSSKLSHGVTTRDSGGSSGHCTHRSEPPPQLQECLNRTRRDSGASTQHSTDRDRSRKSGGSYNSATPPLPPTPLAGQLVLDVGSGNNSPADCSPTCNYRFSDGWKEARNRPILRSKSDVSDRYWRHEGSAARAANAPARPPRSLTQLESFFDRLGLEPESYRRLTAPSSRDSSPVFFDSVSSVDSALGMYSVWPSQAQWINCGSGGNAIVDECAAAGAVGQRSGDPPSIVERNARIIKWLCQCRKVQYGFS